MRSPVGGDGVVVVVLTVVGRERKAESGRFVSLNY